MKNEARVAEETKPAEDPLRHELSEFRRKADAALQEFRAVTTELEKRLTNHVTGRADEQSKVMRRYEEEAASTAERLAGVEAAIRADERELLALDNANGETRRRLDEVHEQGQAVLARCEDLDAKAGDRFGAKLDALGSQVAALASMGRRLEGAEATGKSSADLLRQMRAEQVAVQQGINGLDDRVAKLEKLFESPKARAGA